MSADARTEPRRETLARAVARAAGLGALGGCAVGLFESAKVLATADARYVQWACKVIAIGGIGCALLGALVALPCALFAAALQGRAQHRVAPPSSCAALGSIAALVAFDGLGWIGLGLVVPAAIAATAVMLALRELLAWWPFATRASTWWGAIGLGASLCIAIVAHRWAEGLALGIAWALAAVNLAIAARAFLGKQAPHAATFGVLALVVLAASSHPERRTPEASVAGRNDVLLVTVDTLRADHVGCYGALDAKTPNMDRLAAEGVLFEDATSQANTTGPSHTTILSGLYPAEHGALSNGIRPWHRTKTLADLLARTHSTAAFVSGFTLVDSACGLAPRFDWYDDRMTAVSWLPRIADRLHLIAALIRFAERRFQVQIDRPDRPAGETVDAALEWIGSRGDEPLFTWVHLYDPHAPYEPPIDYARLHGVDHGEPSWYSLDTDEREELVRDADAVARTKALYAAEISYADAQIGRLFDALRESGRFDRTLIVLTSDHGEGLGSHGYWFDHGAYLFDEELHVPLIVRFPGGEQGGTRVKQQVRLLDVAPTVLDVLGLGASAQTSGASLVPLAHGATNDIERPSYAISDISGDVSGFAIEGRRMSLRARGHKLMWSSSHWLDTTRVPEQEQFYDLTRDPDEIDDLRVDGQVPAMPFEDLQKQLTTWREATSAAKPDHALDDDVIDQLRKLGYL